MVEIPEHLLKRSREAMAKAKAARGEPPEEAPSEEAAEATAEPEVEAPAEPSGVAEPARVEAQEAAPEALSPGPESGAVEAPAVATEAAPALAAVVAGGYPPEELVEGSAGIKEVASSRAPGWLVVAFVIVPVISLLYMTQFSHGVGCGQAGTLQVGADGQLQTCEGKPLPSPGTGGGAKKGPDGAEIFAQKCAACHGRNGEGGVGLPLNKSNGTTLLEDFPDAASQVEFVSKGNQAFPQGWGAGSKPPRGVMPAFGSTLSPEEIQAVVQHERSLAGEAASGGSRGS